MRLERNFKLRRDLTKTINGIRLYRIECTRDFDEIKKGQIGGFVQRATNIRGNGWVGGNAKIYENAVVCNRARVYGNAEISGYVKVGGIARVYGNTIICNQASIQDRATVFGQARVGGRARILNDAKVYGCAYVIDEAIILDEVRIFGYAKVCGSAQISGKSSVYGDAWVKGIVSDNSKIFGQAQINQCSIIEGNSKIFGKTMVDEYVKVVNSEIKGNVQLFRHTFIQNESFSKEGEIVNLSIPCPCKSYSLRRILVTITPLNIYINDICRSKTEWFSLNPQNFAKIFSTDTKLYAKFWKKWKPILQTFDR